MGRDVTFIARIITLLYLLITLASALDTPTELTPVRKEVTVKSDDWTLLYINTFTNPEILGKQISIYADFVEKKYQLLHLYAQIDDYPTKEKYGFATIENEVKGKYSLTIEVTDSKSFPKYCIGIWGVACPDNSCNGTGKAVTWTSKINVKYVSSESLPLLPTLLVGGGGFIILITVFSIIIFRMYKRRKKTLLALQMSQMEQGDSENQTEVNILTKTYGLKVNEFGPGEITVGDVIGAGAFGEVFKGDWKGTFVAMKKLRAVEGSNLAELAVELNMLSTLNHTHVVRLLGLYSTENESYIVTEYVESGNLQKLLQQQGSIQLKEVFLISKQIASGMRYLSENNIVHRDLALRNILAERKGSSFEIKLSDFGLSRELKETYYIDQMASKFPVKWSAPEVLQWRKYSSKSDVWSFGIVIWEILECGREPYGEMSNTETSEAVLSGHRLIKPHSCCDELYNYLLIIWSEHAKDRPTFGEIFDELEKLLINLTSEEKIESNGETDIPEQIQEFDLESSLVDYGGSKKQTSDTLKRKLIIPQLYK